MVDFPRRNEFVFRDGRLHPYRFPELESAAVEDDSSDDPHTVFEHTGHEVEADFNGGDTVLLSRHLDGCEPSWVLIVGDATAVAVIRIVGWIDYFEAVRYFEPVIRFNDMHDSAVEDLE